MGGVRFDDRGSVLLGRLESVLAPLSSINMPLCLLQLDSEAFGGLVHANLARMEAGAENLLHGPSSAGHVAKLVG